MGIRHLNSILQQSANNAIEKIPFINLRGKRIAIDTSIYLYRFKSEDELIESFYLMISLFKHYNIFPIFVFDGKPPKEKKEVVEKRIKQKEVAKKDYVELKQKVESKQQKPTIEVKEKLDKLKKTCTTLNKRDIREVKALFDVYGVNYVIAEGEAEQYCARLVQKRLAWAVLSEDMDLFVYGCPRVLRYISLMNRTVVYYNMREILYELKLSQKEFKQICILSGTDYNKTPYSLYDSFKLFAKFKKSEENDFWVWLKKRNYELDYESMNVAANLINLEHIKVFDQFKHKGYNIQELHTFMEKHNFIYI